MRTPSPFRLFVFTILLTALAPPARAQTLISLPWTSGLSAGPVGRDYPAVDDARDIWVVEDFELAQPCFIDRLRSTGAGSPAQTAQVHAVILTDWPTDGLPVALSIPNTGKYVNSGAWGYYETQFGKRRLPAGKYKIMWAADVGATPSLPPVFFVKAGAYPIGLGEPDNAYQYNPGGGANLPQGVLDPVTSELNNQGDPIGCNFTILGTASPCLADFNADTFADAIDYDAFVRNWVNSDLMADVNADGFVDAIDLDLFIDAFVNGC